MLRKTWHPGTAALVAVLATCLPLPGGAEPVGGISIELKTHATRDTYYIRVDLSGVADDYLLDTGAGYMTITEATLQRLRADGKIQFLRELNGQLADGSTVRVPIYRLPEVLVGGCALRDVEAAVLPGASRGLFGLSALRKVAAVELSFEPPTLRLLNC